MLKNLRWLSVFPLFLASLASADDDRPVFSVSESTTVSAVVQSIDYETREVTLNGGDGKPVSFTVSPEVQNLAQVEVGDILQAEYETTFSAEVFPADGSEAVDGAMSAVVRAGEGEMPGGVVMDSVVINATIHKIDLENNTFQLAFTDGRIAQYASRNPGNLRRVSMGDLVVMTITESVAVRVEPHQ